MGIFASTDTIRFVFALMNQIIQINVPDIKNHDWEHIVYREHEEDILINAPLPLGKRIILTHYFNTSLIHDVLSSKAVTGVCPFYNKTPVDWYCKQ